MLERRKGKREPFTWHLKQHPHQMHPHPCWGKSEQRSSQGKEAAGTGTEMRLAWFPPLGCRRPGSRDVHLPCPPLVGSQEGEGTIMNQMPLAQKHTRKPAARLTCLRVDRSNHLFVLLGQRQVWSPLARKKGRWVRFNQAQPRHTATEGTEDAKCPWLSLRTGCWMTRSPAPGGLAEKGWL